MWYPQLGLIDPNAIATSARLLGAGDPAEWMHEAGLGGSGGLDATLKGAPMHRPVAEPHAEEGSSESLESTLV